MRAILEEWKELTSKSRVPVLQLLGHRDPCKMAACRVQFATGTTLLDDAEDLQLYNFQLRPPGQATLSFCKQTTLHATL